jgi:hypothetical protein
LVNITPATVTPGSLQTAVDAAEVDVVLAATRSLAGFGAGAFTRGSGQIGSAQIGSVQIGSVQIAPSHIGSAQVDHRQPDQARSGFGAGSGFGTCGGGLGRHSGGRLGAYQSSPVSTKSSPVSTKQNNQMTRINPVTPGGLGPHPVREPVPV